MDKRTMIIKAAELVKGARLNALYEICDTQQTVSTRKLRVHLDKIYSHMQNDAIHLRAVANDLDTKAR